MTTPSRQHAARKQRLALFMSRLESLPLDHWRRMAYECPVRARGQLIGELRRALESGAGAFETQCAKDAVAAALRRFESAEGRSLVRRPGAIMRIQRVTENAALAILARDTLPGEAYRELASGFDSLA